MKWSIELAEELVSKIAGPESLRLLRLIYNKENISEFDLAEHLRVNINQARHSLYELQKHNLISSTRKKDKEKGWYVYYWTFNNKNARDLLLELKRKKLNRLQKQVEREKSGDYMVCPQGCMTISVEDAMDTGFRCPTCEEMLEYRRDENLIRKKEKAIEKLEKELAEGIELPEREPRKAPAKKKPIRNAKHKPVKEVKRTQRKATRKGKPLQRTAPHRKATSKKPKKILSPAKQGKDKI